MKLFKDAPVSLPILIPILERASPRGLANNICPLLDYTESLIFSLLLEINWFGESYRDLNFLDSKLFLDVIFKSFFLFFLFPSLVNSLFDSEAIASYSNY